MAKVYEGKIYILRNDVELAVFAFDSVQADPEIPSFVKRQMIEEFIKYAKGWEKGPQIKVLTDLLGRIDSSSYFQDQAFAIRKHIGKLSGKKVEEPKVTVPFQRIGRLGKT